MADIEKLRAEAESLRKKIKVAIAYLTKECTRTMPLISNY